MKETVSFEHTPRVQMGRNEQNDLREKLCTKRIARFRRTNKLTT